MRKLVFALAVIGWASATSCKAGKGCPSSGRNVGAEKILSGDPKAMKDVKRAGKFRGGKF
jgi:hypothetical protein